MRKRRKFFFQPGFEAGIYARKLHCGGKRSLGRGFHRLPWEDSTEELRFYVIVPWAYEVPDGVDRNENPWNQQLSEKTDIKIKWEAIPAGGDSEQSYNLLIASDNLPDIFYTNNMTGKVTQLIDDKKIYPLNDYLETYAPGYYNFVNSDDAINKSVKNDNGDYYGFVFLRETLEMGTYSGPVVRKDLLEKLNIETPVTIADWDAMLRAFQADGVKYPLGDPESYAGLGWVFAGAYGVTHGFYVEDGKVHYGYVEPGYKEFLAQMNQWYNDGILEADFLGETYESLQTKIMNSEVGATYTMSGRLPIYNDGLKEIGSSDNWIGVDYPVAKAGDVPQFIQGESNNIGICGVITTSCKNIPLACRLLDYGYTDEGKLFYNFGDESNYEIIDGEPHYTDAFVNDSRGLQWMRTSYTGAASNAATVGMLATMNTLPQSQLDALKTWYNPEGVRHIYPSAVTRTTEESESIATEYTAIQAQVDEVVSKFIVGQESLDNWDAYVATLNSLGLEHVLEVRQAAYDRFLAR